MIESAAATGPPPLPVLLLVADTGGGHRAAARAISEELGRLYPGRFAPVQCDPLGGPGTGWPLRLMCRAYGPTVRLTPWLWGAAWHLTNSRPAGWLLRHSVLALAGRPAARAVAGTRPALIVSLHPLTGPAAARARGRHAPGVPLVTVVTDLASAHTSWWSGPADLTLTPAAGPPVTAAFRQGPAGPWERAALRRSLGLEPGGLLVVLTGGAEGCGRMARRAAALAHRGGDVRVVAICGRNRRLRRKLDRLAARCGGRLTVLGFTSRMADWLRCADLVAGKAGPGTIAEAACCGAPLLLTAQLPGQERGNAAFVTRAGAGRYVPRLGPFLREVGRLHADPAELERMRAASARLGQPGTVTALARTLAGLAEGRAVSPVPAGTAPANTVPAEALSAVRTRVPEEAGARAG